MRKAVELLVFGFPFLLLLFAQLALHRVGSKNLLSIALPGLATATVGVFLAINLLGIPRYIYEAGAQPDYRRGEVRSAYLPELYAANDWQARAMPPGAVLAGDASTDEVFGGLSQRKVLLDADFFESGGSSSQYDGFVLREEMSQLSYFGGTSGQFRFFPLDEERLNALLTLPTFSIVYTSGDTRILVSRETR